MYTHQIINHFFFGWIKKRKMAFCFSLSTKILLYFIQVFITVFSFKLGINFLLLCFTHNITTQRNSLGLKYIKIAQQKIF